jgi:hypothetical protein
LPTVAKFVVRRPQPKRGGSGSLILKVRPGLQVAGEASDRIQAVQKAKDCNGGSRNVLCDLRVFWQSRGLVSCCKTKSGQTDKVAASLMVAKEPLLECMPQSGALALTPTELFEAAKIPIIYARNAAPWLCKGPLKLYFPPV